MNESLRRALAEARTVRFLCSGNMVRSAYAELYARLQGCALPVDSAGTTYRNHGLYPETRSALLAIGATPEACDAFRSRHMQDLPGDNQQARLVLGMTPDHLADYRACFGERDALHLLGDLCAHGAPIADPVMDGLPFKVAFGEVRRGVNQLVRLLAER